MQAPATAAQVLGDLRQLGVRVELDDFGTGWSGLSSLRDLVVDGIKIDRSFVAKLIDDDAARAIIDGVSVVADELDLMIIFEGVEDPAITGLLKASYQGCMQGFGIGRPMPIDDLVRWLALRGA
jgi:EAL domain-containing protein (putative c-di-GMP-specific phosphodiesterase class I)